MMKRLAPLLIALSLHPATAAEPVPSEGMDLAFLRAWEGDVRSRAEAQKVLQRSLDLKEPGRGGLITEAHYLRHFATGYALFRQEEYLDAAKRLAAVVDGKLERPTTTEESAEAVIGLARLHEVSGDSSHLARGKKRLGGKRATLSQEVALGRASLSLYRATADRSWLAEARDLARGIETAKLEGESVVAAGRFANELHRLTGAEEYRRLAERARAAAKGAAGLPLLAWEMEREPVHITIVGAKRDAASRALHAAALRYPAPYKRVEWWDRSEGPMPNPDVRYPELAKPAAFACSKRSCSLPIFDPKELEAAVDRVSRPEG